VCIVKGWQRIVNSTISERALFRLFVCFFIRDLLVGSALPVKRVDRIVRLLEVVRVLQCVAVWCSVVRRGALRCIALQYVTTHIGLAGEAGLSYCSPLRG